MHIHGLFQIGRSALFASQLGLYVTGHNIANVNTPGFNRQEVILETTSPVATGAGFLGRGVRIAGIRRHFDRFIYNQILLQNQRIGMSKVMRDTLSRIEEAFNDLRASGLSGALEGFYSAWQEVATNPELLPARNLLLARANSFLSVMKQTEGFIKDLLKEIEGSINDVIVRINSLLSRIGELNGKILQIESGLSSVRANDLRDQREELLRELSGLIDISYYEEENGSITVTHGTFNLIEMERISPLSSRRSHDGRNYIYINGQDITDTIRQGELAGLLSSRNDVERYQLFGIRRLMASIIRDINLQHRVGYGLDGSTGRDFFTPLSLHIDNYTKGASAVAEITDMSQLTLDEYEITFDLNNYYVKNIQTGSIITSGLYVSGLSINFDGIEVTITGPVNPGERIVISPLKDAIDKTNLEISDPLMVAASLSSSTLPSDNRNALLITRLFQEPRDSLGKATFFEYYNELVSITAVMSRTAQDSLRFEENLMAELTRQRESISGVNLDEEAINLIRYQRAFEAGAKVIKMADELLQTVLDLR